MNRQEIFNQAVKGLASQGFGKSMRGIVSCAYRSRDGKRCAIGWLIPDNEYELVVEGKTVAGLEGRGLSIFEGATENDIVFLDSLQQCHDSAEGAEDMRRNLYDLAIRYRLTVPEELR